MFDCIVVLCIVTTGHKSMYMYENMAFYYGRNLIENVKTRPRSRSSSSTTNHAIQGSL